ncbi:MAG: hypothetical protein KME04_13250 [Pleurocapsa minor GSE-CHR-MK-17-07R]|jgi:hypothetical protein|nr:hypothetical protein [Pleurocapsa minor GSE-CHR-MK 17-07R]
MLDETIRAAVRQGAHPTSHQQARARSRLMQTVYAAQPLPAEDDALFRLHGPWGMLLSLRDAIVRLMVDDRVYDRARELAASKSRVNLHRHYAILSLKYSG